MFLYLQKDGVSKWKVQVHDGVHFFFESDTSWGKKKLY